ncbi:probable phosphoglycerate mutase Pmu1p [Monosporozyma unispora]|nr:hypothetical protein C6P44_002175 [Kazachstania unispora]
MKIRALAGYFESFPNSECESTDSQYTNPCKPINHKDWRHLYSSIPPNTSTHEYKLLLLARHGQGFHNAATDKYGQEAWNSYWCSLPGDENGYWVDSKLTELGQKQVSETGSQVLLPIVLQLGFLPHKFYSSPMRRCLETFIGSWGEVFSAKTDLINKNGILNIDIIEELREMLNGYTCNNRISHSEAIKQYQNYKTHSGVQLHWNYDDIYPELDAMWTSTLRETKSMMDERIMIALNKILTKSTSDEKLISITCHAYAIDSILRITYHPAIKHLGTAKVVPLIIEVEK